MFPVNNIDSGREPQFHNEPKNIWLNNFKKRVECCVLLHCFAKHLWVDLKSISQNVLVHLLNHKSLHAGFQSEARHYIYASSSQYSFYIILQHLGLPWMQHASFYTHCEFSHVHTFQHFCGQMITVFHQIRNDRCLQRWKVTNYIYSRYCNWVAFLCTCTFLSNIFNL